MLFDLDVIGEVSSYGISGQNAFFTIKDETSLLNCVLFNAYMFPKPNIGDKVIVHGSPKYYVKGGKLNFNAVSIQPFGEGDIYKRFLELKDKLEKEGLFDISHKKPIPAKIDRIGVVTSETGAVIHDIINVVTRRNAAQDIVLFPIKVQGIGADMEIANALNFFSDYDEIDAVIVGRGGGSEEDLLNFNSEIVARAVYNCKKFVLSAVGHETNYTLCDFAADLRAPTPSAAAELLTKDGGERKRQLDLMFDSIYSKTTNKINLQQVTLDYCIEKIDDKISELIKAKSIKLEMIKQAIEKLNPTKILEKGYAKIEKNGKSISGLKDLKADDEIDLYFVDGKAQAKLKKVDIKNGL